MNDFIQSLQLFVLINMQFPNGFKWLANLVNKNFIAENSIAHYGLPFRKKKKIKTSEYF